MFNELKTIGDNPTEYIEELNDLAHQEDPTRLTTSASFLSYDDDINKVTDVIAWNQYFGWYGGSPSDMGKWLDANHISYEERHIVEENPTYEELKQWYENGDLPLKKFFNTSGMLYKEQKLKDKLPDMSEEEQLRLLATNGMLVKRPLIVKENLVLTGFKEKEWTEKLL